MEYDTEPYIVLTQCLTMYCYMLMTHCGRIYLHLVLPDQLEHVRTIWMAAHIPNTWYFSKDVQAVLQKGRRVRPY